MASGRLRALLGCPPSQTKASDPTGHDAVARTKLSGGRKILPGLLFGRPIQTTKQDAADPGPTLLTLPEGEAPAPRERARTQSTAIAQGGTLPKTWQLRCLFAENSLAETAPKPASAALVLSDGITSIGRQHQPDFFNDALSGSPGNISFVSRTHIEFITHPTMDYVIVRNTNSNPVFADEELLSQGDWCFLRPGSLLSLGRPQNGHIVFFLKMVLTSGRLDHDRTVADFDDFCISSPTFDAFSADTARGVAGDSFGPENSGATSSCSSRSSRSGHWSKASVPLRGSGSVEWPQWQEVSGEDSSKVPSSSSFSSGSFATAGTSFARHGSVVEALLRPLQGQSQSSATLTACESSQPHHKAFNKAATSTGLSEDCCASRVEGGPKHSVRYALAAKVVALQQLSLIKRCPLVLALEDGRHLAAWRRWQMLKADNDPACLKKKLEDLGVAESEIERLSVVAAKFQDLSSRQFLPSLVWRTVEAKKSLGLSFRVELSQGQLKLMYTIEFLVTSGDLPHEMIKTVAAVNELDLHRHFRPESTAATQVDDGIRCNNVNWKEKVAMKNIGFISQASWLCTVTDALEEPEACLLVTFEPLRDTSSNDFDAPTRGPSCAEGGGVGGGGGARAGGKRQQKRNTVLCFRTCHGTGWSAATA